MSLPNLRPLQTTSPWTQIVQLAHPLLCAILVSTLPNLIFKSELRPRTLTVKVTIAWVLVAVLHQTTPSPSSPREFPHWSRLLWVMAPGLVNLATCVQIYYLTKLYEVEMVPLAMVVLLVVVGTLIIRAGVNTRTEREGRDVGTQTHEEREYVRRHR